MIEIVYKEEKQEAKNGENLFNLPRNIRQIGLTAGNIRIYIEDYVYTFLTRLAQKRNRSQETNRAVWLYLPATPNGTTE